MLLHVLVPATVAKLGFPKSFMKAWLIMMAAMLIDLDHLVADPIYAIEHKPVARNSNLRHAEPSFFLVSDLDNCPQIVQGIPKNDPNTTQKHYHSYRISHSH